MMREMIGQDFFIFSYSNDEQRVPPPKVRVVRTEKQFIVLICEDSVADIS